MSESFPCFGCRKRISPLEDALERCTTGRQAYCSDGCFRHDCERVNEHCQRFRRWEPPYVVGNTDAEQRLEKRLFDLNRHTRIMDDGEGTDYPGGTLWYVEVPNMVEVRQWASEIIDEHETIDQAIEEVLSWAEHDCKWYFHPVKGIALVNAWDDLQSLSVQFGFRDGVVQSESTPSNIDYRD